MEKCETLYEDKCELTVRYGRQCGKVAKLQCKTVKVIMEIFLYYLLPEWSTPESEILMKDRDDADASFLML